MTLAALALVLKVLIPVGFMSAPDRNGLPFAVVICSSQGAKMVAPGEALSGEHEAPSDQGHEPCPFAGQGVAAPPPNALLVAEIEFAVPSGDAPARAVQPTPGRGLAAPPPPARGPPSQLI